MISNDPWARFWALGYRALVPIAPPNAKLSPHGALNPKSLGKAPGRLNGEGWTGLTGWTTRETTEADICEWRDWGAGIGIVCRNGDLGIDCDTLDPELANAIREEVDSRIGPLPLRVGQSPKALFYCRTEPGYRHPNVSFAGGEIEVRTSGQFVASGTHPGTLRGYEWVRELPPREALPWIAPEALDALWEALRVRLPGGRFTTGISDESVPQEALRGKLEDVCRAVASIPNDYTRREDYVRMGYAIKAALPDHPREAYELYFDWCKSWTGGENDDETIYRDWDGYRGEKRVGWGWLRDEANLRTRGAFGAESWFETPEPEPPPFKSMFGGDAAERRRPTHYAWPEPCSIPPRRTLYGGHYVRQWVSSTIAPSKVGKSSLVLVEALCMASGKPLLGIAPAGQFRVWWWNGEDPKDELERRIAAAIQHYGLVHEDLMDRLMVDSGRDMPLTLAIEAKAGGRVVEETSRALIQDISEFQIDCAIFDPFVSFHKVSENDNNMIDLVAKECNRIAGATNSAIELAHHTRKLYGGGATVEDGRGASALLATTRSTRALARMTQDEAKKYGVAIDPRLLFRFADAASNVFAPDPEMDERWFKFESVNLGNGDGEDAMDKIMNGDSVGVVTRFDTGEARANAMEAAGLTPGAPEAVTREQTALTAIRAQEWRRDVRSDAWVGIAIGRALGIDRDTPEGMTQIKNIIKEWTMQGKLVEEDRLNKARQLKTYVVAPVENSDSGLFA